MLKACVFGAGGGGIRLYDSISRQYEIVSIVDNDKRKWGSRLRELIVSEPEVVLRSGEFDVVVIASAPGKDSIVSQLLSYGISEAQIVTSFVTQPLESRRIFLENLAMLMESVDEKAAVAEAGVFQGDFAKYINRYFPGRKLYLFDTFEGFAEQDINLEQHYDYSKAKIADYDNTNEEMVMKKMVYPENCVIRKGYFPQTAEGIEERFCFVNLDMDLYQPTLEGLKWFEDKVIPGGVVLIHDYFADNFRGVRQAVTEYMENCGKNNLHLMPIGDGISIAVCGY